MSDIGPISPAPPPTSRSSRRWVWWASVLFGLLLVVALGYYLVQRVGGPGPPGVPADVSKPAR